MQVRRWLFAGSLCFSLLAMPLSGLLAQQQSQLADTEEAQETTKQNEGDKEESVEDYYELLRLFSDTLDQIDRNYVKDVSRRELMEAAIRGMLEELDQYSNYIPPDDIESFRTGVESEFGGIGIQITEEEGQIKVISPFVGTPAYKAGVLAGDKIIEIAGESTKGLSLDEAVKKLKGKVGTSIEFKVEHYNGETQEIKVDRENIQVETVMGDHHLENDAWEYMLDKENKIAFIRLNSFSRRTTDELKDVLEKLKKEEMKGLVLDLRFNPGGLLSTAIEVCDLFVSKGRIVSTEGRNAPERSWDAKKAGTYEGFPIVVLVNKYSASASEIVSACLQDNKRAVVVGERTWGKGSVQNIIELEHGKSALKLTTAGYLRPNGKNIHRYKGAKDSDEWGVHPDEGFEVKFSDEENSKLLSYRRQKEILLNGGDPQEPIEFDDKQLAKALEHLRAEITGEAPKAEEKEKEPSATATKDTPEGKPKG